MNTHKTLASIGAGLAIAIAQTANAAPAPNAKLWGGSWTLNVAKSKFGTLSMSEKSETRSYTVAGNRLTMRSTYSDSAGKTVKWSYSATTDGKWYPTTGNPNNDHIALTAVSDREVKARTQLKGKAAGTGDLTVSSDGKQLTLNRGTLGAKGAPSNDVMVFDRTH